FRRSEIAQQNATPMDGAQQVFRGSEIRQRNDMALQEAAQQTAGMTQSFEQRMRADFERRVGVGPASYTTGDFARLDGQSYRSQPWNTGEAPWGGDDHIGSVDRDALGEFIVQNDRRRAGQDQAAARFNESVIENAMLRGENLAPTRANLRRLGLFEFEGNSLLGADRAALTAAAGLGLSESTALQVAPLIANVTEATGLSAEESFAFGGAPRYPRNVWVSSDFAALAPWSSDKNQRAAFESALQQTASAEQAKNMAVLAAVRERLVDRLPETIQALDSTQSADREYLTRMHGAMVNGLLATDVYFDQSIPQIVPQGFKRMDAAGLPASLGLRSFEDPASGYFGALYHNADSGQAIYANRGTEGLDKLDVRANVLQSFGLESGQYTKAMRFAQDLKEIYGDKLSFTGHSLGGGLASAQALVTGLPATTFNAAGVNPETVRRVLGSGFGGAWARGGSLVSAYYVQGDPLSAIQDSAQMPAGFGARARQIANNMNADPTLGFSAFNWSDKNLLLPAAEGSVPLPAPARWVNPGATTMEPNVLSPAVGTRFMLAPTAAPSWLSNQLGGVNPVPSGGALHSMATSVMYGLFGKVTGR
ncbi:MAG: hypothetical protein ACT4NV_11090, partial [Rhodoferax sp.]